MNRILTLSLIALILSGCNHIPKQAKLPLPPPINYPVITAADLQCLSDEAVKKLVKRDILKTKRIETLTNIIRTTH